jgi:tRNA modification GTPase
MVLRVDAQDTIAAIATPYGESGIGIVRISGPEAARIADGIFRPRSPRRGAATLETHHIRYGEIVDPDADAGGVIDEVLLTFMAAPKTYTRQDVVEISCHGGFWPLKRILELVLRQGAREALPGEFTKRAFLAGRIDLAQAEAILDIIQARTDEGLRLAGEQLRGRLTREIEGLRTGLVAILIPIEAYIDFSEEDGDPPSSGEVTEALHSTLATTERLINAYEEGEPYRDGVRVAIVGKANAGKSSLLNRLLERERAIVTAVPGTTTDVIEETVNLSGVLIRLMDMAGLREPRNEVEREGVRLAGERLAEAHLVLLVMDRSRPLDDEDRTIFRAVAEQGRRVVPVLNKMDVPSALDDEGLRQETGWANLYPVSALTGTGIEEMKKGMVQAILTAGVKKGGGDLIPVNLRHKRVLERAKVVLEEVLQGRKQEIPWDLTAIEIRRALDILGEIVGETTPNEVLDMIFSRFCIGK